MTWKFSVSGQKCTVIDPDGNEKTTLDWSNHSDDETNANGWSWAGDYPEPVKATVAEFDTTAALSGDIEQQ